MLRTSETLCCVMSMETRLIKGVHRMKCEDAHMSSMTKLSGMS